MVMVRRGSQEWRRIDQGPEMPQRFQRTDGSVMSEEEIAKVASTDTEWNKTTPKPKQHTRREPTAKQVEAWKAVERLGTIGAAAKELGVDRTAVRNRLEGYMQRAGIEGPIPGRVRAPSNQAGPARSRRAWADHARGGQVQAFPPAPTLTEAFAKAAETARREAAMGSGTATAEPFVKLVVHQDGEAHARSYSEGFEDALQQYMPERAIEALFDWLTLNGKDWTQAQAERWFKALTAAIDLIYPTHEAEA